jgi:Mg-chelatase subunit ChlI
MYFHATSIPYTVQQQHRKRKPSLPQVELPLGATEDRICGTIDIEKALTQGVKAYEPGLLVRRGAPVHGWDGKEREGIVVATCAT